MSYLTQATVGGGGGGGGISTIAPSSGIPVVPAGGTVSILGGNVVTTVGTANTLTVSLVNGLDGQILVGGGSNPLWVDLTSSNSTIKLLTSANSLDISISDNAAVTAIGGWNGSILEEPDLTVSSDGAVITLSIERAGGGDLTVVFSDGFYDWDTTPADTIVLTAGSDTSPQINYIYFLQSTKLLTVSTVDWPTTEHAPIATVLCQSAATLQADGAYLVHRWVGEVERPNNQGHIYDLNFWMRSRNATWLSGVTPTLTITTNGGTPDNVLFSSTAGNILQLHQHVFPAFADGSDIYTVNDSVTPYNIVTDLNELLTDSTGGSMTGRRFSLVIWGVASEDSADAKLMVNLPGGTYGNNNQLLADAQKFANYTIPSDFKGTGFLVAQYNLRHQNASGGTWTLIQTIDLRGTFPSIGAGSATSAATEFEDNTFRILDDGDNTKEIAFQASGITTATTRTITMADRDVDLSDVAEAFPADSGSGTPSVGSLALTGGAGINTLGAGSGVEIRLDVPVIVANGGTGRISHTEYAVICGGTGAATPQQSIATVGASGEVLTSNGAGALPTFQAAGGGGGITWVEETTTAATMAVDTGYIANNAALVTLTLPAVAALGSVFRVVGKGPGGWRIAQAASQFIVWDSVSITTVGVGGYLEFTDIFDAVEIVCTAANLEFTVLSSKGNITIV